MRQDTEGFSRCLGNELPPFGGAPAAFSLDNLKAGGSEKRMTYHPWSRVYAPGGGDCVMIHEESISEVSFTINHDNLPTRHPRTNNRWRPFRQKPGRRRKWPNWSVSGARMPSGTVTERRCPLAGEPWNRPVFHHLSGPLRPGVAPAASRSGSPQVPDVRSGNRAGGSVTITLLNGYHPEKYVVDSRQDQQTLWQVIDRTTGEVVSHDKWSYDADSGTVTLTGITPFHVYTVNFLARVIWDTTSMYNHVVNQWDNPHVISVDPYHKQSRDHLLTYFANGSGNTRRHRLIRLTTLAYHFAVDSDQRAQDKFRDWTGYQDTISVEALEDFAKEHGYRLRPRTLSIRATTTPPARAERTVSGLDGIHSPLRASASERQLVAEAHAAGKKTAIFLGDHWIGIEPFSSNLRRDGHRYPYRRRRGRRGAAAGRRYPRTAREGTASVSLLLPRCFPRRRRSGFGVHQQLDQDPSRAPAQAHRADRLRRLPQPGAKFPEFVQHVEDLCHEFRSFKTMSNGTESLKAPVKVAVLNAWGSEPFVDQQLRTRPEIPRQTSGRDPGGRHQPVGMPGRPAGRNRVSQLPRYQTQRNSGRCGCPDQ